MKKLVVLIIAVTTLGCGVFRKNNHSQEILPAPIVLKPDISVVLFKKLKHLPVRIVYDAVNNIFYTCNTDGWVFRIPVIDGVAQDEIPFLSPEEHQINFLQGMVLDGQTFYLVGNHNYQGQANGYGVVEKCVLQPDDSRKWTTLLTTALYPSSGTLFDHAFSGVCLSVGRDSLYISSGSRTDHGEVKDSGDWEGLRETPLTARVFRIPVNAEKLFLPNDETLLQASGYIYANGIRNEFDMALSPDGRLFGIENSGDRDDPEELNWIRQGRHYGFPWRMGGNDTPMQYTPYKPRKDKLIPAAALNRKIFYNDPAYPPRPKGVVFAEPVKNLGPDANWARDPQTGRMHQPPEVSTFTGHRSPSGLVFDVDSTLQSPYTGSGFMLAFSPESEGGYGPDEDKGGDLCQLKLMYDAATDNYLVHTTRLVSGFLRLTDAEIVGNRIYATDMFGNIWQITLPAR